MNNNHLGWELGGTGVLGVGTGDGTYTWRCFTMNKQPFRLGGDWGYTWRRTLTAPYTGQNYMLLSTDVYTDIYSTTRAQASKTRGHKRCRNLSHSMLYQLQAMSWSTPLWSARRTNSWYVLRGLPLFAHDVSSNKMLFVISSTSRCIRSAIRSSHIGAVLND